MSQIDIVKYRAFAQVASSVVHEMKNPLSAITLGLEYLQMHTSGQPITSEVTKNISTAVVKLNTMMENLHQFFIENREQNNKGLYKTSTVLEKVGTLLNYYLARNHIQIKITSPKEEPWLMGDESRMMTLFFLAIYQTAVEISAGGVIEIGIDKGDLGLKIAIKKQGGASAREAPERPRELGEVLEAICRENGGRLIIKEAPSEGSDYVFEFPSPVHSI
jgi:nitrogen fixation/metabolism regulation signal transduction histidine kinase